MAGRRTNLALEALLGVALATGILAWAIGTSATGPVVVAHGVAGLAIVALAPWKGAIARRGLRRRRPGHGTSIVLAGLVIACVVSGLLHATGLLDVRGPTSPLGIHVATGVGAIVAAIAHIVQRPVKPRAVDLTRRNLVRAGALAAGAGVAFIGFEGLLRVGGARGAGRRFTGSHEAGSLDPGRMPVTQWLDDGVPRIEGEAWRLQIADGSRSRSLTLEHLPAEDGMRATLDCTGGWYAEQDWEGIRLDRLVGMAHGASLLVVSATGYGRRFPLGDASSMLLATRVGGDVLSAGHGFPARLVAPGRRGFWWVKWVTEIRVDDTPSWWQPPFPVT
jgi:DMSO/TMAO reductase YedYZ molybdopterin-dependent catalytic subunit